MKNRILIFILFVSASANAQELYPNSEPASTMGKNVLGLRGVWETYNEQGRQRHQLELRTLYGVTKNFTVYLSTSISNHHGEYLPNDFTSHSFLGSQLFTYTSNKVFGREYPFRWGGIYAYGKYRFLSIDGDHQHFRMAAFANYSTANLPHDIAEPNSDGDTGGFGCGLIATVLKKRFAATATTGFILPNDYHEVRNFDTSGTLTTDIAYGKAFTYGLSLGYLLYPKVYRDYHQPNYNVYLELLGKYYGQASVTQNGMPVSVESFTLYSGNYLDATGSFQAIINSNTRLDLSIEVPLINRSWDHFYPLYQVAVQHYFYFGKKKSS
ncbi:MAG: hypothetical protein ACHQD9_08345 [Chitinophagales bacterium]